MTENLEPHERPVGKIIPYSNKERRLIEKYLKDGLSISTIGQILNRPKQSLSCEIKRHSQGKRTTYDAEKAIEKAREKFKNRSWILCRQRFGMTEEALAEKIGALVEKGYSKNRIGKELGIGKSTVDSIITKHFPHKEIGVYGNEKRITNLEQKLDAITSTLDIILDIVKSNNRRD